MFSGEIAGDEEVRERWTHWRRRVRLGNMPNWLAHHLPCSLLLVDTA